jgi:hypothetical protein
MADKGIPLGGYADFSSAGKLHGSGNFFTVITSELTTSLAAAFGFRPPNQVANRLPIAPICVLISIIWTAWDPTYSSLIKARLQGRDIRQRGKHEYIVSLFKRYFFSSGILLS